MGETYEPPTTETDQLEEEVVELREHVIELRNRVGQLEHLMSQLATAAIASTAAFDVLRGFSRDQTGLGGASIFDFDADDDPFGEPFEGKIDG